MKTTKVFIAILTLSAGAAWAQETVPMMEVGTSLSFENFRPGNGAPGIYETGGSASFVYNFNRVISGVADIGGYHSPSDANFNPTTATFLFGPRVSLRHDRFIPYFQTLFGTARQWTLATDPATGGPTSPNNGFAAAFGGGIDIRANSHFAIKPFQMEYLMTKVSDPLSTAASQNDIRYSTGVVFTFGSK